LPLSTPAAASAPPSTAVLPASGPPGAPPACSRSSSWITDSAIGSIITTVAVLLTHMLSAAVAPMNPAIRLAGRVPTRLMIVSAMRRCSPQLWSAAAMMKPPMKRKITGLA
jgi:hypothetical protein